MIPFVLFRIAGAVSALFLRVVSRKGARYAVSWNLWIIVPGDPLSILNRMWLYTLIQMKDPTICSCEYCVVGTTFGGAPYVATNRVRGVPKWGGGAMRTLQLGPSVELPMGPRTV